MSARIKGATVINGISVIREVTGPARYQLLVGRLPEESQQLLRRSLMAVEWVPVDTWSPCLEAVFDVVTLKDELHFRRILRAICKRDFSSAFRAHLRGLSAEALVEKSDELWRLYFDSGSLSLGPREIVGGRVQATLQLRDLETRSQVYATMLHASLEQLLIMTSARDGLVAREREVRRGGMLSCSYAVSFLA